MVMSKKNITVPVQNLSGLTKEADIDTKGLSFILKKGPKEVMYLSKNFQEFYDKLFLARQKSEKIKQELQKSLNELSEARLQLIQSEKLASVGQLDAGVAHEINNPIGAIASNFNTLKSYAEDLADVLEKQEECFKKIQQTDDNKEDIYEELKRYQTQKDVDFIMEDMNLLLGDSHTGIDKIKNIVSDLLEFSHVNAPDLTQVNINELMNKTIHLIDNNRLQNITIKNHNEKLPDLVCHKGKIGQALMNILMNAIEAIERTEKKGMIHCKTFMHKHKIYIEIQNNGCGIEEDQMNRIFDPFYTTKSIGDGTGLGLHLTQSIMENHDGAVMAVSKPGVGTKFRLELPLKEQA